MSKDLHTKTFTPIRDLIGFILLAMAVFLFLALVSYDPTDPSWNTQVAGPQIVISNYGGIVGSYLADFLMQFFGYASLLIPILMLGLTWAVVFSPTLGKLSVRLLGCGSLLLSVSLFLSLMEGDKPQVPAWGGLFGYLIRKSSVHYLGVGGSFHLAFTVCLIGLVLTVGLTFKGVVKYFEMFLRFLKKVIILTIHWNKKVSQKTEFQLEKSEHYFERGMKAIRDHEDEPRISLPQKVKNTGTNTEELPKFHTFLENFHYRVEKLNEKENRIYKLPGADLLEAPQVKELSIDQDELLQNAQILERKLKDFAVYGKVVEVQPGPVVTMYEFEPAPGIKVNQISRLNDDLALALKALSVRITPIPGKAVIGIEVANRERLIVYLKDVISDPIFKGSNSLLTLALGKDISGTPYVTDLRKMPHLLVAGATGSGKSVSVNSMILSILYKATPEDVRMILVDPKMLELSFYDNIPHLLLPVVTDPRKAAAALRWAVVEMERRYRLMAEIGVRNIEGYNKKVPSILGEMMTRKEQPTAQNELPLNTDEEHTEKQKDQHTGHMPYIMIVIDELADLMMVSSREVEESIIRLAQMARAAGIHLLLATQRPSVDVITGVIKANMPARISFQVSSKTDSRTILDSNGAELLLGAGDMLFIPPGTSKLTRIHGAFVTDNEVKCITDFWKAQGKPNYDDSILKFREHQELTTIEGGEDEEMYNQALNLVRLYRVASISMIQRKLRIGYNRAARLVERMDEEGILAPGEVGKPREVRMSRIDG